MPKGDWDWPGALLWREISTQVWRCILEESNDCGDLGRAAYARWMLTDILEAEI